jgi:aryl-alcohol dehydrogenase-like predicted oxidoreductase
MSLILGSVQFGVKYGITNKEGQPSRDVAFEAMDAAWNAGIYTLDSAQGYGQANQVIADYHASRAHRFSVINKIMRHPEAPENMLSSLARERDAMGIDKFDCIMFHHAPSVADEFPALFFEELKKEGITDRTGLSIETPEHYHSLSRRFHFDVIQLPLNLMSQNFMPEQFMTTLKQDGVEIHARSAFLQGLLLGNPADIPVYLTSLTSKIDKFQGDCLTLKLSYLAGCLLFLRQSPLVDHIVVGAQNARQLQEIAQAYEDAGNAFAQGENMDWHTYASDNFAMIHPLSWLEMAKRAEGKAS